MKVGKPKSKRTPVRLRHKIEKASAAKQRKQRKEAKKNPQWRSRLKKDPGIPNLFPHKDKVLAEIEESKRKKAEEQERRREVARVQREGSKVKVAAATDEEEEEELMDDGDGEEGSEGDEMEEDTHPMAALVASAQARAKTYQRDDEEEDEDDEEDEEEFGGFEDKKKGKTAASLEPTKKALPKQALADPIKAVSALVDRLQQTQDGIQQMLDYYQLPPLVTAGSDTTTRLLVDVARKRGRLGRGGVPNLNAAALTIFGDLNEERLKLPALQQFPQASSAASNKGEVQVVSQLAKPFTIEGLFGEQDSKSGAEMEVEDA